MSDLELRFTSTPADLLEAHDAQHTARTGVRKGLRVVLIGLGLLWAVGPIVVLISDPSQIGARGAGAATVWGLLWDVVVWLGGIAIIWLYLVAPVQQRWRLRHQPAQDVRLVSSERGVEVTLSDGGTLLRPWPDIFVESYDKGVLMTVGDAVHWIPNRAFVAPMGKDDFVREVEERCRPV